MFFRIINIKLCAAAAGISHAEVQKSALYIMIFV